MIFIFSGFRIWSQTRFKYQAPALINLSGPQFPFSESENYFRLLKIKWIDLWTFLRKHRNAPSPKNFLARTVFFPPQQFAFGIFSLRPAAEHGYDGFPMAQWRSSLQLQDGGKVSPYSGNSGQILGMSLDALGFAADRGPYPSSPWSRRPSAWNVGGSPHKESHKNSNTNSESVLGRKYLTVLG